MAKHGELVAQCTRESMRRREKKGEERKERGEPIGRNGRLCREIIEPIMAR